MTKVFHVAKTGNRTWKVSDTQGMTKHAAQEIIWHDLVELIEMQDTEGLNWCYLQQQQQQQQQFYFAWYIKYHIVKK